MYWGNLKQELKAQEASEYFSALTYSLEGRPLGSPDPTVYANQAGLMQRLSWVNSAVSAVAGTCASLAEFKVFKKEGEEKIEIGNHDFLSLLAHPNDFDCKSKFQFFESVSGYLRINGNSYIFANDGGNHDIPPFEMFVLRPNRIRIIPDSHKFIRAYQYSVESGARPIYFDPEEIIHLKSFNPNNDWYGLSPIESIALAAELDFKQQQYERNFFSENNAKVPGALAFADYIEQNAWDAIKGEIKERHGGTKREMLMLRGAGKGGVQWVSMGLSQQDMQFLQSRQFTKEEIYQVLAPGLLSILEKNATENSAVAGEKTFREYCVWIMLQRIAEGLSAQLLPRYAQPGENVLLGEFEDIRHRDRRIALNEQDSFGKTHTIAEIRKKFYNDAPLGDVRDDLLPIEITYLSKSGTLGVNAPADVDKLSAADTTIGDTYNTGDTNTGSETAGVESSQQTAENKAIERKQFAEFARKRTKQGKRDAIRRFRFNFLNEQEQKVLLAPYEVKRMNYDFRRILFLLTLEHNPESDAHLTESARHVQKILDAHMPTDMFVVRTPQECEPILARYDPHNTLVFDWTETEEAAEIIDRMHFAHTGSSAWTISLVLNREKQFIRLRENNIPVPLFAALYSRNSIADWKTYPAIMRSNEAQGSEDMVEINSAEEAQKHFDAISGKHPLPVLLMKKIEGREFSVGLWGDGRTIEAFPVSEANFARADDDVKGEDDKDFTGPSARQQNIIPADIPAELELKLVETAKSVFRLFGIRTYARIEFRMDGEPIVIDVNSEPEITEDSLMCEMAKRAGGAFEDLILGIVRRAMRNYYDWSPGEVTAEEARPGVEGKFFRRETKSAESIARDFENELADLVNQYWTGDAELDETEFRDLIQQAIENVYLDALEASDTSELDPEDQAAISELYADQEAFVAGFLDDVRDAKRNPGRRAFILGTRIPLWAASIGAVALVALAISAGTNDEMVTWRLGPTEEHCRDCARLNGQRHRRSWFAARGYFPRQPGAAMECGGWKCECRFE